MIYVKIFFNFILIIFFSAIITFLFAGLTHFFVMTKDVIKEKETKTNVNTINIYEEIKNNISNKEKLSVSQINKMLDHLKNKNNINISSRNQKGLNKEDENYFFIIEMNRLIRRDCIEQSNMLYLSFDEIIINNQLFLQKGDSRIKNKLQVANKDNIYSICDYNNNNLIFVKY